VNQLIIQSACREDPEFRKELEAQRNETVTHNSVFAAAHRQMPDDDCKIDIRHFLFLKSQIGNRHSAILAGA